MQTRRSKRLKLLCGASSDNESSSNTNSERDNNASTAASASSRSQNNQNLGKRKAASGTILFEFLCDDTFNHVLSFLEATHIFPLRSCNKTMNSRMITMAKEKCAHMIAAGHDSRLDPDNSGSSSQHYISQWFKLELSGRFLKKEGFDKIDELKSSTIIRLSAHEILSVSQIKRVKESCVERALKYMNEDFTRNFDVKSVVIQLQEEDNQSVFEVYDKDKYAKSMLRVPLVDGLHLRGFSFQHFSASSLTSDFFSSNTMSNNNPASLIRAQKYEMERIAEEYSKALMFDYALNICAEFKLHTSEKNRVYENMLDRQIYTQNIFLVMRRTRNIVNVKDRADMARLILIKIMLVMLEYHKLNLKMDVDLDIMEKVMRLYHEILQSCSNKKASSQTIMSQHVVAGGPGSGRVLRERRNRRSQHQQQKEVKLFQVDNILDQALEIASCVSNRVAKSYCLENIAIEYAALYSIVDNNNNSNSSNKNKKAKEYDDKDEDFDYDFYNDDDDDDYKEHDEDPLEKALQVASKIPNAKCRNDAYTEIIQKILRNNTASMYITNTIKSDKKIDHTIVTKKALQISSHITNNRNSDSVLDKICRYCLSSSSFTTLPASFSTQTIDEALDIANRIQNFIVRSHALEQVSRHAFRMYSENESMFERAIIILQKIGNRQIKERTLEYFVGKTFEDHGIQKTLNIFVVSSPSSNTRSSSRTRTSTRKKQQTQQLQPIINSESLKFLHQDQNLMNKCVHTICKKACKKKETATKVIAQIAPKYFSPTFPHKYDVLCDLYESTYVTVPQIIQYVNTVYGSPPANNNGSSSSNERDARIYDLCYKMIKENRDFTMALQLTMQGMTRTSENLRRTCIRTIARKVIDCRDFTTISKVLVPSTTTTGSTSTNTTTYIEVGSPEYIAFLDTIYLFLDFNQKPIFCPCALQKLEEIAFRMTNDKLKSRAMSKLVSKYMEYAAFLDYAAVESENEAANNNEDNSSVTTDDSDGFAFVRYMVEEAKRIISENKIPLKRYENKAKREIETISARLEFRNRC